MFWFLRKKVSQTVQKIVPPREPMNDETLAKVLDVVNNKLYWSLDWKLDKPWSVIPPVSCPIKFGGWGYVAGRTKAFIVNARVAVCEADDDMDFTECCVLLDGVPTLLILRRGYSTTVTIIAERDFTSEVFKTAAMKMNAVEDFRRLPAPVQKVMDDVLYAIYQRYLKLEGKKEAKNPIEKMLNY